MKKLIAILLAAVMIFALASCEMKDPAVEKHKIGVIVYDLADEQVLAFKDYLENYIGANFDDVSFLYSRAVSSKEEEMEFISACIDDGVEGIMAFNSYDLPAEVELCAKNKVYYIRPSATVSDADFKAVENNPYFIGAFGPGTDMEYQSGYDMAKYFADMNEGDKYFIFTGGATMGNVMHIERTKGMLDALQKAYGVTFSKSSEEIAKSAGVVTAGKLTVCLCGGYITMPNFVEDATKAFKADDYSVVLTTIPVPNMLDTISGAHLGLIDCFNETNARLFSEGKVDYVCGKFSSIIGPAFAAMYNCIKGNAADFRYLGKAIKVTQGFWVSTDAEDYMEKYAFSNGIVVNAYDYTDLLGVIKAYNTNATYNDLKKLAEAYDFESVLARSK